MRYYNWVIVFRRAMPYAIVCDSFSVISLTLANPKRNVRHIQRYIFSVYTHILLKMSCPCI